MSLKLDPITSFNGKHRFLSNFWPAKVVYDGLEYPTVEHAYQAAKTLNLEDREKIRNTEKPGETKKLARKLELRKDWEEIKLSVMEDLLRQKFKAGSILGNMLMGTGTAELIEGNTWGDVYWGVCKGKGQNNLGKLLMKIRHDNVVEFY